jgi:hypothetical protein
MSFWTKPLRGASPMLIPTMQCAWSWLIDIDWGWPSSTFHGTGATTFSKTRMAHENALLSPVSRPPRDALKGEFRKSI